MELDHARKTLSLDFFDDENKRREANNAEIEVAKELAHLDDTDDDVDGIVDNHSDHGLHVESSIVQIAAQAHIAEAAELPMRAITVLRVAIATTAASLLVFIRSLREPMSVFCAFAVLVVVDRSAGNSIHNAAVRLQGVSTGSLFAFLILSVVGLRLEILLPLLFVWLLVLGYAHAVTRLSSSTASVAGVAPLLLLTGGGNAAAGTFFIDNLKFNFLAILISAAVSLIPPPSDRSISARRSMQLSMLLCGRVVADASKLCGGEWVDSVDELKLRVTAVHVMHARLLSELEKTSTELDFYSTEPLLWRNELALTEARYVLDALKTLAAHLKWMLLSLNRRVPTEKELQRPSSVEDALAFRKAYLAPMAHVSDRFAKIVDKLFVLFGEQCLRQNTSINATSELLIQARRLQQRIVVRFHHSIYNSMLRAVRTGKLHLSTKHALAYNAFQFVLRIVNDDIDRVAQSMSEYLVASSVLHGVVPSTKTVRSSSRRRRVTPSNSVGANHAGGGNQFVDCNDE